MKEDMLNIFFFIKINSVIIKKSDKMKKRNVSIILIYLVSFIYMEFFYKILIFDDIFRISIINMLLFLLPLSVFLGIVTKLFKNSKVNKIIFIIILSVIPLWFSAQYVVQDYFDFYISLSAFEVADQVASFLDKAVIETLKRLPGIIMFYIPLIISLIFSKYISFEKYSNKKNGVLFVFVVILYGFYILSLNIDKDKLYSSYSLYYEVNDVALNIENFGVLNTFLIDTRRAIFGFEEKIIINNNGLNATNKETETEDEPIVYEYNNLNIDFENLLANEGNDTIKKIHEYMKNDSGTLQNDYTGMFKGKNLILFMAESFNEIAINKDLTPTLYKLVNSGFVFENFYSPTIYSTIGGEFQELTGLYPYSLSLLSKFRSGNTYFPQGIGNKFNELNYSTFAYHNNSYSFQDRNKYLESLGFNNFKACYNGLEKLINCKEWPQSDVSMIDATYSDYINEDNFMVYYATVSGHATYKWSSNAAARKNKEEYLSFNLPYSERPATYLAAQMELDKALELLIQKLDEAGKLEDTVIALVGDHYPYELTIDEVNEISSFERDGDVTVNKSSFILWNSEMDTVKVSKVGSQIDVIPTLYNLFEIEYDSRLFMGKDILSTEGGLAMFGNRSWVTDKGTYYTRSRTFIPIDGVEVEDDYVKNINQIVNNKINMSKLIIENNYYKKVLK